MIGHDHELMQNIFLLLAIVLQHIDHQFSRLSMAKQRRALPGHRPCNGPPDPLRRQASRHAERYRFRSYLSYESLQQGAPASQRLNRLSRPGFVGSCLLGENHVYAAATRRRGHSSTLSRRNKAPSTSLRTTHSRDPPKPEREKRVFRGFRSGQPRSIRCSRARAPSATRAGSSDFPFWAWFLSFVSEFACLWLFRKFQ